jgi:hypothetical protein
MRAKKHYKPKKSAKNMKKQRESGKNLEKQECEEMQT